MQKPNDAAGFSNLHVRLLAAARPPGALPVAQHAPHALHLRRRQALVQLGVPGMFMLMIITKAVPQSRELVQLWNCTGVIVPRGVVMTSCAGGRLLTQAPESCSFIMRLAKLCCDVGANLTETELLLRQRVGANAMQKKRCKGNEHKSTVSVALGPSKQTREPPSMLSPQPTHAVLSVAIRMYSIRHPKGLGNLKDTVCSACFLCIRAATPIG